MKNGMSEQKNYFDRIKYVDAATSIIFFFYVIKLILKVDKILKSALFKLLKSNF